jgi:hypothetical protein
MIRSRIRLAPPTGTIAGCPRLRRSPRQLTCSADDAKDTDKVEGLTPTPRRLPTTTPPRRKAEPLAVKLADNVGDDRVAINFMWTLITGFLVMFMQAGFALGRDRPVPRRRTPATPWR